MTLLLRLGSQPVPHAVEPIPPVQAVCFKSSVRTAQSGLQRWCLSFRSIRIQNHMFDYVISQQLIPRIPIFVHLTRIPAYPNECQDPMIVKYVRRNIRTLDVLISRSSYSLLQSRHNHNCSPICFIIIVRSLDSPLNGSYQYSVQDHP